eukprot:gene9434-19596_t
MYRAIGVTKKISVILVFSTLSRSIGFGIRRNSVNINRYQILTASVFGGIVTESFLHMSNADRMSETINSSIYGTSSILPNYDFINASVAKAIDESLMSVPGFSIDQLMELAGLSVASAAFDWNSSASLNKKVLIICGPGNNGGDGLVAARHLVHFGLKPTIVYPKRSNGQLFINLIKQCEDLDIEVLRNMPEQLTEYNFIIDAIFGFSFEGTIRAPFDTIIHTLATSPIPVMSVDVPSGWHVEQGDISHTGFTPQAVISLTLPKKCMQGYLGVHYLGGRFIPPRIRQEFHLNIPLYPGTSQ